MDSVICTLVLSILLVFYAIRFKNAKYFLFAGVLAVVQALLNVLRFYAVNQPILDTVLLIADKLSVLLLALVLFYAIVKEKKDASYNS